jgi:hypothetical protein
MKKEDELRNPKSCFNKANNDELMFILLERDPTIISTVLHWINTRVEMGLNTMEDDKIKEAYNFCNTVASNREKNKQ